MFFEFSNDKSNLFINNSLVTVRSIIITIRGDQLRHLFTLWIYLWGKHNDRIFQSITHKGVHWLVPILDSYVQSMGDDFVFCLLYSLLQCCLRSANHEDRFLAQSTNSKKHMFLPNKTPNTTHIYYLVWFACSWSTHSNNNKKKCNSNNADIHALSFLQAVLRTIYIYMHNIFRVEMINTDCVLYAL